LNDNYRNSLSNITHQLIGQGLSPFSASHGAPAEIYRVLLQQAQMLSYIDVFHVLMWVVFGALPLVLLMQKPKRGGPSAEAAA
jgi:hypothetical protein